MKKHFCLVPQVSECTAMHQCNAKKMNRSIFSYLYIQIPLFSIPGKWKERKKELTHPAQNLHPPKNIVHFEMIPLPIIKHFLPIGPQKWSHCHYPFNQYLWLMFNQACFHLETCQIMGVKHILNVVPWHFNVKAMFDSHYDINGVLFLCVEIILYFLHHRLKWCMRMSHWKTTTR